MWSVEKSIVPSVCKLFIGQVNNYQLMTDPENKTGYPEPDATDKGAARGKRVTYLRMDGHTLL